MARSQPTYFIVAGLEPTHDPAWATATVAQRAAYLRVCRVLVLTEWDRQTAAGLDRKGQKMKALKWSTILHRHSEMGPADPHAPPLQPAHSLSRTRSLIDARIVGTAIKVYWKFDPISGRRWGTILGYHRDGKGNLPVRDVFGLSPESFAEVLRQAHLWWRGYSRGLETRMPVRPRPGKAGRPPASVQPEYKPKTPHRPGDRVPLPTRTADVALGSDIYTMSKGAAAELLKAVGANRFTGFRSYE